MCHIRSTANMQSQTTPLISAQADVAEPKKLADTIRAHYTRVVPLLVKTFGTIPVVGIAYPKGFHGETQYVEFAPKGLADRLSAVKARTRTGLHRYIGLTA